uniref:hypothetical protein n=1 Tax=Polynucleobacter sp. TaxID=2029855 RepID=UPI0040487B07
MYCSATCRKLQFKAKKRTETRKKGSRRIGDKLVKLSASSFGKYLVREFKRSGTVEILKDHNAKSLADLAALKRRCTSAAGFENGESLGFYELSHIYPVGRTKSKNIGLLNANNLTITPKEFNRKHSTKLPSCGYQGQHISREKLELKWKVLDSSSSLDMLRLARKYIGDEFDSWLSKHVVTPTQKQVLIKQLSKSGFDKLRLQDFSLTQLKTMAADEDVAYFNMSKSPDDIKRVLIEELSRLDIENDFTTAFEYLELEELRDFYTIEMEFIGTDSEKQELEEFVVEQSLACLHGQPHSNKWREKPVLDWFKRIEISEKSISKPYQEEGDEEFL